MNMVMGLPIRLEINHFPMEENIGELTEFAAMVREIIGDRTLRAVQLKTGVGHTTVLNMTNGLRPKAVTIKLFADGMGADPNPLLKAAGYPPLRRESPEITRAPEEVNTEGKVVRYFDPDDPMLEITDAADDLALEVKRPMLEGWKAQALAMRKNRTDTIGKKADEGD